MTQDIQKYRKHVDNFDLSDQEKDELIRVVQSIMQNFIDRAFGDDPVQLCHNPDNSKDALAKPVVIDLVAREISRSDITLTDTFNENKKKGNAAKDD